MRSTGSAAALAAGLVGWRLRFRVSAETAAWRRGARGERRTTRALRKLVRAGWTVLHDVAVPSSRANGDHLLVGPPGVFLVDSKAWHGTITQAVDGQAWHNGHPLDQVIATVRWEAEQVTGALGAPVLPLLCVHDTRIPWDEIYVANVPVLTPARLLAVLRSLPAHMDEVGVMLLAEHARHQLHPAI
jgi:Nuclease-related domain